MNASRDASKTDINNADVNALSQLPGVGKELATRIVAGRPYEEMEQLLQVQGLGANTYEKMRPFISVGIGNGEGQMPDTPDQDETGDERSPVSGPGKILDRLEETTRSLLEGFPISRQVVAFVLVTGLANIFISILLTLLILAGLNRTLVFGRHSTVKELRSDVDRIATSLDGLSGDLASVDQRLQAVEGLSGRMATLESDFELIMEDVNQAMMIVDQMSEEVNNLSIEVMDMSDKVNLFDGFLEGIRVLLLDLFEPEETTTSP